VSVTFATEGVGAALLAVLYALGGEPLPAAIWKGVFTSISAFCNAGFALNSDSLMSYRDRPAILAVIGAIIVIGGRGPPSIAAAGPLRTIV
jgi:trk system potassium uptake protein TrkH